MILGWRCMIFLISWYVIHGHKIAVARARNQSIAIKAAPEKYLGILNSMCRVVQHAETHYYVILEGLYSDSDIVLIAYKYPNITRVKYNMEIVSQLHGIEAGMLQNRARRAELLEVYGTAKGYLMWTISSTYFCDNALTTITNIATLADKIMHWVSQYRPASTSSSYACANYCFYHKPNEITIEFCIYVYTRSGNDCNMQYTKDTYDMAKKLLTYSVSYDTIGGCATLFNTGSSVVYVKWRRDGSSYSNSTIWCQHAAGWGGPAPVQYISSLSS
ncbi:hypothetical protein V1517DRAFT_76317 [Lipomyces orientalis]|uniref:Uncharacterized protein n=1 Tax=Lipomyces orientalis TaxID=1233043 RepID=A0ACC3TCW8_9ASCO